MKNFILLCGVICVAIFLVIEGSEFNSFGVHIVSVGQGDGSFIEYEEKRFVIDVGKDDTFFSYLDEWMDGARYIDGIFISHNEYDHIGGLAYLMRIFPVGFVAFSQSIPDDISQLCRVYAIPCFVLFEGDRILANNIIIDVLWPPAKRTFSNKNDGSLVLRMKVGNLSFLFSGDISASVEKELVGVAGDKLLSDVLKVPHHGSSYSSSPLFIQSVSPYVGVVSVGENRYGHPSEYLVDIFNEMGIGLFRTDRDGTIRVFEKDGAIEVFTQK